MGRPDCRILWADAVRVLDRPGCVLELAAMTASATVHGKLSAARCAAVR